MANVMVGMGGELSILDTRAASIPVLKFGEDRVFEQVSLLFENYNQIATQMMGDLVEDVGDEYIFGYGDATTTDMQEVAEFGTAEPQKQLGGDVLYVPLRHFEYAVGWTRRYFETASVGDLVKDVKNVQIADTKKLRVLMKQAMLNNTTVSSWLDRLGPAINIPMSLKRFYNADSGPIAQGPNGELFDGSSHTHYVAVATGDTLLESEFRSLITNVAEHSLGLSGNGSLRVYINVNDEAAVRALASFNPAVDTILNMPTVVDFRDRNALQWTNRSDRLIGNFEGAQVWVKPWIPQYYMFAFDAVSAPKPLAMRTYAGGGLKMCAEIDTFPLRTRIFERNVGFAVKGRQNGSWLYTHANSWANPTITS